MQYLPAKIKVISDRASKDVNKLLAVDEVLMLILTDHPGQDEPDFIYIYEHAYNEALRRAQENNMEPVKKKPMVMIPASDVWAFIEYFEVLESIDADELSEKIIKGNGKD